MLITPWMQLPIIDRFFLDRKVIVMQKMPYGKVERHAYKVNEQNEIEVHGSKFGGDGQNIYNPICKGKPTYDGAGRLLFKWTYGDRYAYSLFEEKQYDEKERHDETKEQAYQAGLVIGELRARGMGRRSPWEDPMFLVMAAVVFIVLINLAVTYFGLNSLGAEFLGGTPGA